MPFQHSLAPVRLPYFQLVIPALFGVMLAFAAGCGGSETTKSDLELACDSYCECMDENCSTSFGYPWNNTKECLDDCVNFREEDRECWAAFCEDSKTADIPEHSCEHASGRLGAKECP